MDLLSYALLILGICLLFWLSYQYLKASENVWRKQGIKCVPILQTISRSHRFLTTPLHEMLNTSYKENGKLFGEMVFNKYSLTISDPDLLRHIFVKDFQNFVDRMHFEIGDPVFDNILSLLPGKKWKRTRTILSPTFSTGKIKKMTNTILDCAESLQKNFRKFADSGEPVDIKKYVTAFALDVIASTAFGMKIDSLNDPNNPFVLASMDLFSPLNRCKSLFLLIFRGIFKILGFTPKFVMISTEFFQNTIRKVLEERKKLNQERNDFLQLMINASDKKQMGKSDSGIEPKETNQSKFDEKHSEVNADEEKVSNYEQKTQTNLSEIEIVAQSIMFFIAGFDTVGSTLCHAIYELALNEQYQETLVQEVDEVLRLNKNEFTYENMQSMKYMDCIVSETLRKYPPGFILQRIASNDCTLSDTGIKIPKDSQVVIPVYGLHHDEQYYPEPEKFNPNRFSPEEKESRHPFVYLPFGAGPRHCIAMRFALIEVKLCIAQLLRHYRFRKCSKTKVPLKFKLGNASLNATDIFITIEKRTDVSN